MGEERGVITGDLLETSVEIVGLNPSKREVTVRDDLGEELTFVAGEGVENFADLSIGDGISVQYYEGVVAAMQPADSEDFTGEERVLAAVGASENAATEILASAITMTVTVDGIYEDGDRVEFTDANGDSYTRTIMRDEMKDFVRTLSPGDKVNVSLIEGLAVDITVT